MKKFKYNERNFKLGACYQNCLKICKDNNFDLGGCSVAIGFIVFKLNETMAIVRHCYIVDEFGKIFLDTTINLRGNETKNCFGYINLVTFTPVEFEKKCKTELEKEDYYFAKETYDTEIKFLKHIGAERVCGNKFATLFNGKSESLVMHVFDEFMDTRLK